MAATHDPTNENNKPTLNGVPVNDAPVNSNPEQTGKPAQNKRGAFKQAKDKKSTAEPTATKDVIYDVPPADLGKKK